jgi:hypothetical protein
MRVGSMGVLALVALGASGIASPARVDTTAGLVFTRNDSSVWVARADGSHARLAVRGAFEGKLSPDGRWLAYVRPEDRAGSGRTPLYVVRVAGGKAHRLGEAQGYTWSPDSARLVFTTPRGAVLVEIPSLARRALPGGETFSPDGKALAFSRTSGGGTGAYRGDIFIVHLFGGRVQQLTHDHHSVGPLWGRGWIVYHRFRLPDANAYSITRLRLIRPDGTGDRALARGGEDGSLAQYGLAAIRFSAGGTRLLACTTSEFHCPPVMLTVPDGRKVESRIEKNRSVVRPGELATAEDLSSDGTRVLVDVGPFDGSAHHRLYAIPFRGGKPRLLVREANRGSWASR